CVFVSGRLGRRDRRAVGRAVGQALVVADQVVPGAGRSARLGRLGRLGLAPVGDASTDAVGYAPTAVRLADAFAASGAGRARVGGRLVGRHPIRTARQRGEEER